MLPTAAIIILQLGLLLSISTHAFLFISPRLQHHHSTILHAKSRRRDDNPNNRFLNEQKRETFDEFAKFHEAKWRASQISTLEISSDQVFLNFKPIDYTTNVQTSANGLEVIETFQWSNSTQVSRRTLDLTNSAIDIDSVDASYSLDASLPHWSDLPFNIVGSAASIKFGMEFCIATSHDSRVRSFVLYNLNDELSRITVCEEHRVANDSTTNNNININDIDEAKQDVDRFVNRLLGDNPLPPPPPPPQTPITADTPVEQRMAQLQQALAGKSASSSSSATQTTLQPAPMSLFGLVSGVWLGDVIVRNHLVRDNKGFASSGKNGFAEWITGVQKVALQWKWDFDQRILQRLTAGRSMGLALNSQVYRGTLVSSDLARGKSAMERLTHLDFEMGQYVAFLLGSTYIKVPRQLTLGQDLALPFNAEFSVFTMQQQEQQQQQNAESTPPDSANRLERLVARAKELEANGKSYSPEVYCSRLTRLYNTNGSLSQGTSSFFILNTKDLETSVL